MKNTPLRVVFSTLFSVFGYPDETLSLVFDILLENVSQTFSSYVDYEDFYVDKTLLPVLQSVTGILRKFSWYDHFEKRWLKKQPDWSRN